MKKELRRVHPATPYEYGQMGSFGSADHMLIRQFQYPDIYSEKDLIVSVDHDRLIQRDFE